MQTLFNNKEENIAEFRPLAERMRPETLEEFFGQDELAGQAGIIRNFLKEDKIPSVIFWGPPGSGKTTLANIIAKSTKSFFLPLSAVTSNIPEIRVKISEAAERIKIYGQRTVMFIDEIHRFNKLQQDAFLPHLEQGTIILIGATTQNPSFEVNSALLSRCKVLVLQRLSEQELCSIIKRALFDEGKGIGKWDIQLSEDAFSYLASYADGDARRALNLLEEAAVIFKKSKEHHIITAKSLSYISQKSALLYDKKGEEHYNLISALHKCMRDSDADAALYWLGRMLEAGEDPLYIARRIIRFASEDIGTADPNALVIAVAAKDAFHFMGRGEGDLALAQAVVYLSRATKNNNLYIAYQKVKEDIKNYGSLPVPLHLRNAPTKLMKELDYGKGYKYAHNFADAKVEQEHFPDKLGKRKYF